MTITTFLKAKTVDDVLKATYDALELHRTNLVQQNVRGATLTSSCIRNEDLSRTLQDVLSGGRRTVGRRLPAQCLLVDFDHSAPLDCRNPKPQALMRRTGTPMYIARSMCIGRVLKDAGSRLLHPMPELSAKTHDLYVRAHGQARYDRYNDTEVTVHGVTQPNVRDFNKPYEFCHRPEHDVESIYWSMVSVLLHVCPKDVKEEPVMSMAFVEAWYVLLSHRIPDANDGFSDARVTLLSKDPEAWPPLFLGDMKSVGQLLSDISFQVYPEYALCGDGLQPDHLHEALQRLILQYLVDHDDIPLDPHHLRPIPTKTQHFIT